MNALPNPFLKSYDAEVEPVAREFARTLLEWIGAAKLKLVADDPHAGDGICLSHDFCDANMAMFAAMQRTILRAIAKTLEQGDATDMDALAIEL